MEGKKHTYGLGNKTLIISFLVLLFHAVGLFGFLIPEYQDRFIALVPFHLLLMFFLIVISQKELNANFYTFLLTIYLAGFGIEYFGVHTGLIFGSYHYGKTLGFKLAEIPLMIGVNWILLIYSAGVTVQYLNIKNVALKSALAAALLVGLDALIEPIAIRFDYWSWANDVIPMQNYIAWFVFSFACFCFFNVLKFNKQNPAAVVLLLVQFLFFIALNLWA